APGAGSGTDPKGPHMSNAAAPRSLALTPITRRWIVYGLALAVAALVAVFAVRAFDQAPTAPPALDRAGQAWADGMNGLAERQASGTVEGALQDADGTLVTYAGGVTDYMRNPPVDAHASPEISRVPAPQPE